MNSNANKKTQEKPIEVVFHNIHDHGTEIADMWMDEVKTRTGGRVRFRKTSGQGSGKKQLRGSRGCSPGSTT